MKSIIYKGRKYVLASKARWESSEDGSFGTYTLKDSTGDLGSILAISPNEWYAYTLGDEPLNASPVKTAEEAMNFLEEEIGIAGDKDGII